MKASSGIFIIVLCVFAGVFLVVREARKEHRIRKEHAKGVTRFWYCEACEKEVVVAGGAHPWAICPTCNQKTTIIRVKAKCKNCKHEFAQFEVDAPTRSHRSLGGYWGDDFATNAPCPECGSKDLISLPKKK